MANCIICAEFDNCPWRSEPNAMCSRYRQRKMTNADRIRSMLDEELADWLTNYVCSNVAPYANARGATYNGKLIDWLKQEATDGNS